VEIKKYEFYKEANYLLLTYHHSGLYTFPLDTQGQERH